MGELTITRERFEESLALYRPERHDSPIAQYGTDLGVAASCYHALTLWHFGYPDQAVEESYRSITLAEYDFLMRIGHSLAGSRFGDTGSRGGSAGRKRSKRSGVRRGEARGGRGGGERGEPILEVTPQPFDGIHLRRVGWKEQQGHMLGQA